MRIQGFAVCGTNVPELEPLDRAMTACMSEHGIPGGSLAVMRNGQPVYARGFGWADLQTREPVTPQSLFRIASLSKPVTAVGILKLVQDGKLNLDDRIFDILPFQPFLEPETAPDPRTREITLRQCLNHTGGWDRAKSGDTMFFPVKIAEAMGMDAPAEPEPIIRWVSGQPLDFAPGQAYAYSNYGYCLLGRVMEKLTGRNYEEWMQTEILAPIGIHTMRIGRTHFTGRAKNEVVYYPVTGFVSSIFQENLGEKVPAPYGAWYLEAMDSHGGWIASASDMARFANAFQDFDRSPILNRSTIEQMFAPPPAPVGVDENGQPKRNYYGLGWAVDLPGLNGETGQQHHNGMLTGTATVMRRRDDGLCWAALFNRALGRKEAYVGAAIAPLVNEALMQIMDWPNL